MKAHISKNQSFVGLFFIFCVAYVFTPYWTLGANPIRQAIYLSTTVGSGIAWAYWFSKEQSFSFDLKKNLWIFCACAAMMIAVNIPGLAAEIPWRGDEDFHIGVTGSLVVLARRHGLVFFMPFLLFPVSFFVMRKGSLKVALFFIALLAAVCAYCGYALPFAISGAVRYPLILRYVCGAIVFPVSLFVRTTPEVFYRAVPFLSALLLVFYCTKRWCLRMPISVCIVALCLATIPLMLFYSSLLYLELPAVLLLSVAFFNADRLLTGPIDKIKADPAWIALTLAGMIKETAITVVVAFLFVRLILSAISVFRRTMALKRYVLELLHAIFVVLPLGIYLWYRSIAHVWRVLAPEPNHFFDPEMYAIFARALMQQFDVCLYIAITGLIVLIVRKRFVTVSVCLCSLALELGFHMLDEKQYVGFSRWNLMLIPALLVCLETIVRPIFERRRTAGSAALLCAAAINVMHSPLHLEGSRKSYWGNYLCDMGEHSYPYRAALLWMTDRGMAERAIYWTGLDFGYFTQYYASFPKMQYAFVKHPTSVFEETGIMAMQFSIARAKHFDSVLYHPIAKGLEPPKQVCGYTLLKVFSNKEHRLFVYDTVNPTTRSTP